jgi:WD40 repeat protein
MKAIAERLDHFSHEKKIYCIQNFPNHLARSHQGERFRKLLTSFDFLSAKVSTMGPQSLVDDYDLLSCVLANDTVSPTQEDDPLYRIQRAIRLSAHVLGEDSTQLPGQLFGRLGDDKSAEVQRILQQALASTSYAWLRPLTASLAPSQGQLIRTLTGHTAIVLAVAVTPDGTRAVSASQDGILKLWNIATGFEESSLTIGPAGHIRAIAIYDEGQRVLVGGSDCLLKIWNLEMGVQECALEGHSAPISSIALAGARDRALTGSEDGTVAVWDLRTRTVIRTMKGHTTGVNAVAVTADGHKAISAGKQSQLRVWDVEHGDTRFILEGPKGPNGATMEITAVVMTADGRRAVTFSQIPWSRFFTVWDLEHGKQLFELQNSDGGTPALAITPDGRLAATAADYGKIKVWQLDRGVEKQALAGHADEVRSLAMTPDGRLVVSASQDKTLRVWDLTRRPDPPRKRAHEKAISVVAITADGLRGISSAWDSKLKVWDPQSGRELVTGDVEAGFTICSGFVRPDGRVAFCGTCLGGWVLVWDLQTGTCLGVDNISETAMFNVTGFAVERNSLLAICTADQNRVEILDLRRRAVVQKLQHPARVNAAALFAHGTRALTGTGPDEHILRVWDLHRGVVTRELTHHTSAIMAVAVSEDGSRAASTEASGRLMFWDLKTSDLVQSKSAHKDNIKAVGFTPRGNRVFTASADRALRVWDFESGGVVATFTADDKLRSCVMAADGKTIMAGGESGQLYFFRFEEPESKSGHRLADRPGVAF